MINSEVLDRIIALCQKHTRGVLPAHVELMRQAVIAAFQKILDEKGPNWAANATIQNIFRGINPVEAILGREEAEKIIAPLQFEERVQQGFEPLLREPAYVAYWQYLWLTTFYLLRAARHTPPVQPEQFAAV